MFGSTPYGRTPVRRTGSASFSTPMTVPPLVPIPTSIQPTSTPTPTHIYGVQQPISTIAPSPLMTRVHPAQPQPQPAQKRPRLHHIIDDTPHHIVTTISPLPDLITRLSHTQTYARVDHSGWCIVTYDDNIYIWHHIDPQHLVMMITSTPITPQYIYLHHTTTLDGIMICTSHGHIMYWSSSSIESYHAHQSMQPATHRWVRDDALREDEIHTDVTLSLQQGESVTCFTPIHASRLFAVTTSMGRVFGVMLTTSLQLSYMECPAVTHPSSTSGVLSVLGKWWGGATPTTDSTGRAIVDVATFFKNDDECGIWCITTESLSLWRITRSQQAQQWSLPLLPDLARLTSSSTSTLTLSRIITTSTHVYILVASSSQHYLVTYTYDAATMRHVQPQHVTTLPQLISPIQMGITESNDGIAVYICTRDSLYMIHDMHEPSRLTLTQQVMMGMGIVGDGCMVITSGSGVIQARAKSGEVRTTEPEPESSTTEPTTSDMTDVAAPASTPRPTTSSTDTPEDILRSGFYLYTHGDVSASRIRGHEFITSTRGRDVDVDGMVINLCKRMMDAKPFVGKMSGGEDDSTPRHLLDKHEKYTELITYLVQSSIWTYVDASTQQVIREMGEQLYVTQALRTWLHRRDDDELNSIRRSLMSYVMSSLIQQRGEENNVAEGWSRADLFFSRVTAVQDTIPAVIQACAQQFLSLPGTDINTKRTKATAVSLVNTIIEFFLTSARYRQDTHHLFPTTPSPPSSHAPWSFSDTLRPIYRTHLRTLSTILSSVENIRECERIAVSLYQQMTIIGKSMLRVYQSWIATVQQGTSEPTGRLLQSIQQEYGKDRSYIITLLRDHSRKRNTSLEPVFTFAEQFQDYGALVSLCDETSDGRNRLISYLERHGIAFARVLFDIYTSQNKTAHLLTIHEPREYDTWLAEYLRNVPSLAPFHDIYVGSFQRAANTLESEAVKQTNLAQKKTLLSLSKLAYLAAGQEPQSNAVQNVNSKIDVCAAQAYVEDGKFDVPVLSSSALLDRLLTLSTSDSTRFILAIETLEKGILPQLWNPDNQTQQQQQDGLKTYVDKIKGVWIKAIAQDEQVWIQLASARSTDVDESWADGIPETHVYQLQAHLEQSNHYGRVSLYKQAFDAALSSPQLPARLSEPGMQRIIQIAVDKAHQQHQHQQQQLPSESKTQTLSQTKSVTDTPFTFGSTSASSSTFPTFGSTGTSNNTFSFGATPSQPTFTFGTIG